MRNRGVKHRGTRRCAICERTRPYDCFPKTSTYADCICNECHENPPEWATKPDDAIREIDPFYSELAKADGTPDYSEFIDREKLKLDPRMLKSSKFRNYDRATKQDRITYREFYDKAAAQNFQCPICLIPFEMGRTGKRDLRRVPCLDHDHETGQNRDILCMLCNGAFGGFRECVATMLRAIAYAIKWGCKNAIGLEKRREFGGDELDW